MTKLRQELESSGKELRLGSGWLSGVLALVLAGVGLGAVLCLRYPNLLTVPEARGVYAVGIIRLLVHLVLIGAFLLGIVSIVLRSRRVLGFAAIGLVFVAVALGGSTTSSHTEIASDVYLGLDWFLLSLIFTGIVFIPIERILGNREQPIFRFEWREDLLYFLISTLFVQVLAFLSMFPALTILHNTDWIGLRGWIGSLPFLLQFLAIVLLTDLVQYWMHRTFHRVPWLWKFHAVHHSAQVMDWLASSRMHLAEIVVLRGLTVIPMYVLGFGEPALYTYLVFVFFQSALVHSNLRVRFGWLDRFLVTPRYHHWHHGIEREAIDVNFAVHFPLLDRLFGTYHLPSDGRWPAGYGVANEPPKGFWRQFLYPFVREKPTVDATTPDAVSADTATKDS